MSVDNIGRITNLLGSSKESSVKPLLTQTPVWRETTGRRKNTAPAWYEIVVWYGYEYSLSRKIATSRGRRIVMKRRWRESSVRNAFTKWLVFRVPLRRNGFLRPLHEETPGYPTEILNEFLSQPEHLGICDNLWVVVTGVGSEYVKHAKGATSVYPENQDRRQVSDRRRC